MKIRTITPGELRRGRKFFLIFALFNFMAFPFLSGNIITLLGLKLEVGNLLIGVLSSAAYISFIFLLLGRAVITRFGTIRLLSVFYTTRNMLMLPILLIPLLESRGMHGLSILILALSVFTFNICRGIHLTSDNPVIAELSGEKNKGLFFSQVLIYSYLIAIITGALMAYLLMGNPALPRYTLIIGIGAAAGFIGSRFISGIPEPKQTATAFRKKLGESFRNSLKQKNFRRYYTVLFLSFLAVSMFTPFLIVYLRRIYGVSDSRILVYNIIGNCGAFLMAVISSYSIDRLGPKPLFFTFTFTTTAVLIPIILSPNISSLAVIFIIQSLIFFFHLMGTTGMYNAGRIYFLSIVDPKEQLNLGIIYFLIVGIAGAVGSLLGGTLLDLLNSAVPGSPVTAFRIYFTLLAFILITLLFLLRTLGDTASYSIKDAITFILSPRDFRALTLLHKLEKSKTLGEEKSIIKALRTNPSVLSVDDLLEKINSPSLSIRARALLALKEIPLNKETEKILISELKNHPFTTAYLAAEILGEKKVAAGIKPLRNVLKSEDYFLAAQSMTALAEIGDRKGIQQIVNIISETTNPRLIIHGVKAVEIYGDPRFIPDLLSKLEIRVHPFIRDEIILSLAGILQFYDWFYAQYVVFLDKGYNGVSLLSDYVEKNAPKKETRTTAPMLEMIQSVLGKPAIFQREARKILTAYPVIVKEIDTSPYFIDALENNSILHLERFRYLTAAMIVYFATR